jgi:outer membrane protein
VAAARADAEVTRAQWKPFVLGAAELLGGSTNNTTASYLNVPGLELPRIGGTKVPASDLWSPHPTTLVAVSLSQELFDFGRIAAQEAVDDFAVETEVHRADDRRLAIDLAVEESFFAVLAARAVLKAAGEAVRRAEVHRDEARAGVQGGLRAPIDLTRAEADLTRFEVARIRAQGGLQKAQSAFAAAVGVPDPMLDAAGEAPPPKELPSLASALARAAERNPQLLEAIALLRAQESFTDAVGALLRPNLAITASFSAREGGAPASNDSVPRFDGWLPEMPNWDVGLVLRWPLYDGMVRARRDASLERESVRKAELEALSEEQNAAIQQAYVATGVAEQSITALTRARDAAVANAAQAEARFKAGLGTSVELADAEAVRTDAEIQLAVGGFELARTRAVLARLIAEDL